MSRRILYAVAAAAALAAASGAEARPTEYYNDAAQAAFEGPYDDETASKCYSLPTTGEINDCTQDRAEQKRLNPAMRGTGAYIAANYADLSVRSLKIAAVEVWDLSRSTLARWDAPNRRKPGDVDSEAALHEYDAILTLLLDQGEKIPRQRSLLLEPPQSWRALTSASKD